MGLKGKVVWITGASSGIGLALAKEFSAKGARLILSGRRVESLEQVKKTLSLPENDCIILPFDLADTKDVERLADEAAARMGRIDMLVNNGGISQRSWVKDTPLSIDKQIMEVNYFGTVALTKAVLPFMMRQEYGHIIVISSIAGKFGFFLRSAYSASKHALHGFFESMRLEVRQFNINVLLVCPGKVRTNISVHALTSEGKEHGMMDRGQDEGISAEECASEIIEAILANKEEIYTGRFREGFGLWLKRIFPSMFSKRIRKLNPE
jgi:short-subunit dehydrogenase